MSPISDIGATTIRTLLLRGHGLILPDEEIPHVRSLYQGKTLEDICDVVSLKICATGKR